MLTDSHWMINCGLLFWHLTTNFSQALLDGERATTYLTRETRNELLYGAATEITVRYYELAADLVSVVST